MRHIMTLLAIACICGCGGDDSPGPILDSIIGTWSQVYEDTTYHYTITFRIDGTGSEWAMHDGDPEFTSEFTWTASAGNLSVDYDSGDNFVANYALDGNTMTITMGSTPVEFIRIE